jgi:hypothetical protein
VPSTTRSSHPGLRKSKGFAGSESGLMTTLSSSEVVVAAARVSSFFFFLFLDHHHDDDDDDEEEEEDDEAIFSLSIHTHAQPFSIARARQMNTFYRLVLGINFCPL